jgi:hypothetical protein
MSNGAPAKGKVNAASEDEARTRLASMGVSCDSIEQEGAKPAGKSHDLLAHSRLGPMVSPDAEQRPAEPESPPPEVERSINSTLAAFRDTRGYAAEVAPRGEAARQQQVLYGSSDEVLGQARPMLASQNGRVLHAIMHPDAKGKMTLLLVVEHDR